MQDSLNPQGFNPEISKEMFRNQLIATEIIVTLIVMVGFYLIFNRFNKKNKVFKNKEDSTKA